MREGFEGLDYYFPVQELRFQRALRGGAERADGHPDQAQGRVGALPAQGVRSASSTPTRSTPSPCSARPRADDGSLWLPFYDQTNGKTTYPGGRYLDLELAADGTVEVDFNRAYNPLCAYNPDGFNCTLPPDENRLPFAVEAGEKLLGGAH